VTSGPHKQRALPSKARCARIHWRRVDEGMILMTHLSYSTDLVSVTPIALQGKKKHFNVTLLSLESYTERFILNGFVDLAETLSVTAAVPNFCKITARIEADTHFEAAFLGPGDGRRWRFNIEVPGNIDQSIGKIGVRILTTQVQYFEKDLSRELSSVTDPDSLLFVIDMEKSVVVNAA
jgi:hypothetical protein